MHLGAAVQLHQKYPYSQKAIETLHLGVGGLRSLHPAQVQPRCNRGFEWDGLRWYEVYWV